MQYPELNIGEFARKHPSSVELEYDEDEEEYYMMVEVEPEENYPVTIGAKPDSIEDLDELFGSQFSDFESRDEVTVYGNKKEAIKSTAESDAWARFERPTDMEEKRNYREALSKSSPKAREDIMELDNPDYSKILQMEKQNRDRTGLKLYIKKNMDEPFKDRYEPKGWAMDISPVIKDLGENYEDVVDEISSATLYVISRAESEGEVRSSHREFHKEIIEEIQPDKGPVQIEIEENRFDYHDLVSGTISQSKTKIEEKEDELDKEDWNALLEAEKEGKNRETFKPYLEEKLEEDT